MFLNLPNMEEYTGHCFRRTSASILANTGASMERIKRLGAWESEKTANGYIEDSIHYKSVTHDHITSAISANKENHPLPPSNSASSLPPPAKKYDLFHPSYPLTMFKKQQPEILTRIHHTFTSDRPVRRL